MPRTSAQRGALSALTVTAFIDTAGSLIVVPLLPFYARSLGATGVVVAALVSSFAAAQVLSAPLWGKVSDRYGRRPALLAGLAAAAVAYLGFAYATAPWVLVLWRVVQGAGGGTTGVIQAYVADAVEPHERARALGRLSAATSAGVVLGPPIGALAVRWLGRPGPGWVAAVVCVINLLFAMRYLREPHDEAVRAARGGREADGAAPMRRARVTRAAIARVLTRRRDAAPRLIWTYAAAMGAYQAMSALLAVWLQDRFGVGERELWMTFAYIGVISVAARAGVLGRLVARYGEGAVARAGLLILAAGLVAVPAAHGHATFAAAIGLVPLGAACTFPCVTSLLSRAIEPGERGVYLGVQQAFGGSGR